MLVQKRKRGTNTMKRFNVLAVILPVICCLFAWNATQIYAETVTMQFTGVGPEDNNSGGVYTFPYDFTVTPSNGGASYDLSLMCISFNEEIYLQNPNEQWSANVVTAGSLGQLDEEYAYLYTEAALNVSNNVVSGAYNWADWALDENNLNGTNTTTFLADNLSGAELTDAENDVAYVEGLSGAYLAANYADYLVYQPTGDGYSGTTNDGIPQTFIGYAAGTPGGPPPPSPPPAPTPEPGSLLLLGTGLLGLATVLYSRRNSFVKSS